MFYVVLILLFLIIGLMTLHLAVVFGAALGSTLRGGYSKGKLSVGLRILSGSEVLFLILCGVILAIKAKIILEGFYDDAAVFIWGVSGYFAFNTIINMASKSHLERLIIAPIYMLLFTGSLFLALS